MLLMVFNNYFLSCRKFHIYMYVNYAITSLFFINVIPIIIKILINSVKSVTLIKKRKQK